MKIITAKMLRDVNACDGQVRLFIETFGGRADVTEANCLLAVEAGLNVAWAAEKFGSKAAFDSIEAPADAEFWAAEEQAWEKFFADEADGAAAIRDAAMAPAKAKYTAALARAFYAACAAEKDGGK